MSSVACGEGSVRDRCRRQRRASARRSRRVRPCASAARTSRHRPPSASSRSRSSRPSPPARFSNTSADTICRSLQPWLPLTATWRATDCSSPAARHSSKYKGSPARPVSPASPTSLSYWNGKRPCVTFTHLFCDGVDSQISAYLPDQSGPTRHFTSFDAESGEACRCSNAGMCDWRSNSSKAQLQWRHKRVGPAFLDQNRIEDEVAWELYAEVGDGVGGKAAYRGGVRASTSKEDTHRGARGALRGS